MSTVTATAISSRFSSVMTKVEKYFFRPGGAYTIGVCRIALFGYLYLHVLDDAKHIFAPSAAQYFKTINISAYYPKSLVWFLFPSVPPSASIVDLVLLAATVSTAMAIVGLRTRLSMIVSVLSLTFLGALIFSWEPLWSHPYNSGLIAGLGFMFGRAGDTLSIDSVIARLRGRPLNINRDVYWWPVILGQFGVAAVYFGGFYAKWSTPDFTYDFSWVFSDNLRNSVSLPWLIRGQELPWNVDLLVNSPFLWKLSALGHLLTQGLPMLALFSLWKPWIRLLEGFVFVAGVILLKAVMGMWNIQWIILAAFFIDWEYFLAKAGLMFRYTWGSVETARGKVRTVVSVYALVFAAINLVIIGVRLDDTGWNRLYPFSSMNFYSSVLASKPYSEHKHYPFTYGQVVLTYPDGETRDWHCALNRANSYLVTFSNGPDAEAKATQQANAMTALVNTLASKGSAPFDDCAGTGQVNPTGFDSIDLYSSILNIPPYPERVKFEVGHRALVSRYERAKNRVIAASAAMAGTSENGLSFTVASQGLNVARYEILVRNDPWKNYRPGPLLRTAGSWNGSVFTMSRVDVDALPAGWLPYVIRIHENDGSTYDFFGGIIYR